MEKSPQTSSSSRFAGIFLGADNQIRTDDLILTKDVLCRLSYISMYRLPACGKVAGAEGFEPSARGFGDHCSTS